MACFWYLFSIFKPNKFRCQVQLQWPHKICWRLHAFQIWHLKLNFNTENRFQFNRINLTLKQSMSQICRSLVLSRQRFQYTISSTHTHNLIWHILFIHVSVVLDEGKAEIEITSRMCIFTIVFDIQLFYSLI